MAKKTPVTTTAKTVAKAATKAPAKPAVARKPSQSVAEGPLTPAELKALVQLDTPTVCNALELLAPDRRARGFTVRTLQCPFPDVGSMVGYARTGTVRSIEPSGRGAEDRRLRLDYYRYVAEASGPTLSLLQDLDGPAAGFGSFWGEVHSAVHKALGSVGVVTDGSIRDIPQWAPGFGALCAEIVPSHAWVHLVDFGGQVNIAGMIVRSDDLIHADRHGAVVIPSAAVARRLPEAADACARREKVILDVARGKGFTVAKLVAAIAKADEIH